jgi:hypothetical protein
MPKHSLLVIFLLLALLDLINACSKDEDCNLNGYCKSSVCSCKAGWKGSDCGVLNLGNTAKNQGYNIANWSEWCGSGITISNITYLFASRIDNHCGLNVWTTNSACVKAISNSGPDGPFSFVDYVLPAFCHNPTIHTAVDGTLLLYHIGDGTENPNSETKCVNGSTPPAANVGSGEGSGYITINYASSVNGTWTALGKAILTGGGSGAWDEGVTNPGPWMWPNGSVLLSYRGKDSNSKELLGIASAPNWKGPYTRLRTTPLFNTSGAEDPFLWQDVDDKYHLLFNDKWEDSVGVGGHAYSNDGINWVFSNTRAYTHLVTWTDGTALNMSRRERPQLLLDSKRTPLALYTAVKPASDDDHVYNIATPIN